MPPPSVPTCRSDCKPRRQTPIQVNPKHAAPQAPIQVHAPAHTDRPALPAPLAVCCITQQISNNPRPSTQAMRQLGYKLASGLTYWPTRSPSLPPPPAPTKRTDPLPGTTSTRIVRDTQRTPARSKWQSCRSGCRMEVAELLTCGTVPSHITENPTGLVTFRSSSTPLTPA